MNRDRGGGRGGRLFVRIGDRTGDELVFELVNLVDGHSDSDFQGV